MNIRHVLLAAGSAIALSALATGALASGSVQATANATATILSPITLNKTQDMAFGQVVRPTSGTNTFTLSPTGTVSMTGAGNGSVVGGTATQAKFVVTAPNGATFSTTQALAFTQTGLLNIQANSPTATSGVLGTIPVTGGTQELNFGGQFDVSSSTTPQAYTGTLTVTVNYN